MKLSHVVSIIAGMLMAGSVSAATFGGAQSQEKVTYTKYSSSTVNGFRVALNKGMNTKIKVSARGLSGSDTLNHDLGISLGYASVNINNISFKGALIVDKYTRKTITVDAIKLEGNATYGLSDISYLFGGLNLNQFTSGNGASDWKPGLGFQLGGGVQLTREVGIDLAYRTTKNTQSNVDLEISGLELGLHATF